MVSGEVDYINGLRYKNYTKTRKKQIGKWYHRVFCLLTLRTTPFVSVEVSGLHYYTLGLEVRKEGSTCSLVLLQKIIELASRWRLDNVNSERDRAGFTQGHGSGAEPGMGAGWPPSPKHHLLVQPHPAPWPVCPWSLDLLFFSKAPIPRAAPSLTNGPAPNKPP